MPLFLPFYFVIAEDVSLGSARKPSGFGPVARKLPPIKPIEEQDSPIRVLVGLRRLGVDFHDLGLGRGGLGSRGASSPAMISTGGPSFVTKV